MSINNTPQLDAVGAYTLAAPYATQSGVIYKCESIEGFDDLKEKGIDVYSAFYGNQNPPVSRAIYERDKLNNINIVTLMSQSDGVVGVTIKVPSSFITTFPRTTSIPYSDYWLSCHLGLLPETINLDMAKGAIIQILTKMVGVNPHTVDTHLVSVGNRVSHSDHERLENQRKARLASFKNPLVSLDEAMKNNEVLQLKVNKLEQQLIDIARKNPNLIL